jgi:hypothetical protein
LGVCATSSQVQTLAVAYISLLATARQGLPQTKNSRTGQGQCCSASLPERCPFLLGARKESRAKNCLTTASDMRLVQPIAQHIGVFNDVIASDGELNLKGTVKQKILEDRYGSKQFDYLGDSAADLAVWESAMRRCLSNHPRVRSKGRCSSPPSNASFTARSVGY